MDEKRWIKKESLEEDEVKTTAYREAEERIIV